MIITGLERVAIVQADDTDFSDVIWLDKVSDQGEYTEVQDTAILFTGDKWNTQKLYNFTFTALETDKYYLVDALAIANTGVNIFAYGIDGCVIWRKSAVMEVKLNKAVGFGKHQSFEVSVTALGVDVDIHCTKNILRDTLRTCDYAITSTQWTITSTTFTAPVDTSNSAFSGKTYQLSGAGSIVIKEFANHFPVKPGMIFYFRADGYSSSTIDRTLLIDEYASTTLQVSNSITSNGIGSTTNLGSAVTISDADTDYIKIGLSVSGGVGIFDNLMLSYGSRSHSFQRG